MLKNLNETIVQGGDFNLPIVRIVITGRPASIDIDWDNGVVNLKASNKSQCELPLSSLDTHALAQIHKEPTREENIGPLDHKQTRFGKIIKLASV